MTQLQVLDSSQLDKAEEVDSDVGKWLHPVPSAPDTSKEAIQESSINVRPDGGLAEMDQDSLSSDNNQQLVTPGQMNNLATASALGGLPCCPCSFIFKNPFLHCRPTYAPHSRFGQCLHTWPGFSAKATCINYVLQHPKQG